MLPIGAASSPCSRPCYAPELRIHKISVRSWPAGCQQRKTKAESPSPSASSCPTVATGTRRAGDRQSLVDPSFDLDLSFRFLDRDASFLFSFDLDLDLDFSFRLSLQRSARSDKRRAASILIATCLWLCCCPSAFPDGLMEYRLSHEVGRADWWCYVFRTHSRHRGI